MRVLNAAFGLMTVITALPSLARAEDSLQARCAFKVMDLRPAYTAIKTCSAIETEEQLGVALKGIRHDTTPEFAIEQALRIKTLLQAKCALRTLNVYWMKPAVETCLKIETQAQLDFVIAAMDAHWDPGAAAQAAAEIKTELQMRCALKSLEKGAEPMGAATNCAAIR